MISYLPTVNAALNAVALTLLLIGYVQIKSGRVMWHRRCMVGAFAVSSVFLACYLTYRWLGEEKKFLDTGWIRPVYFFILITHVVLAAIVPILAGRTLYLAARGRIEKHRRLARITLPIWVYVSVTGILVYFFLFCYEPPLEASDGGHTLQHRAAPRSC